MRVARLCLPVLLAASVLPAAAVSSEARVLQPHRAVYDIALGNASERSGITGLTGRMVYEFTGSACDGYTVSLRFVTRIDTPDVTRMTDQQTTTFEEGDGGSFSFSTRSFVDQQLDKELRGVARAQDDDTLVALEKPDRREVELEKTRFPTRHLLELLDKADSGETFYETTIFDGSEDADKVMTTTVVVGRKSAPDNADPEREALDALETDAYRPVDIAYFDLSEEDASGEELPVYRISFKLHDNGVTRDLFMDYGDFSMTGRLVDLSLFDAPDDCTE